MLRPMPSPDQAPFGELNTTPLIDVMLVLLVMFIVTIPIQTHAVKLDLPRACEECPPPNPLRNEVGITSAGRSSGTGNRSAVLAFAITWLRHSA